MSALPEESKSSVERFLEPSMVSAIDFFHTYQEMWYGLQDLSEMLKIKPDKLQLVLAELTRLEVLEFSGYYWRYNHESKICKSYNTFAYEVCMKYNDLEMAKQRGC